MGHSKGGGEAIANAVVTNKNVITFNPSRTAFSQYGLDESKYTANSKRYVVDGEILNSASTFAVGDAATMGEAKILEGTGGSVEKHYMKVVIEGLEKAGY